MVIALAAITIGSPSRSPAMRRACARGICSECARCCAKLSRSRARAAVSSRWPAAASRTSWTPSPGIGAAIWRLSRIRRRSSALAAKKSSLSSLAISAAIGLARWRRFLFMCCGFGKLGCRGLRRPGSACGVAATLVCALRASTGCERTCAATSGRSAASCWMTRNGGERWRVSRLATPRASQHPRRRAAAAQARCSAAPRPAYA